MAFLSIWFHEILSHFASIADAISTIFSTKSRVNVREKVVEKFLLTSFPVAVYSHLASVTGLPKRNAFR
jgi:hypothetical protein